MQVCFDMVPASPDFKMEVDNSLDNSLDSDSSSGNEAAAPDLSLEWTDMRVTFRVLNDNGQDGEGINKGFAIYPELDQGAPSSKTLLAQRRRQIRAQKEKNPMTLSNLIGGAGGLTTGSAPPAEASVSRPPPPPPQGTPPSNAPATTPITGGDSAEKRVPVNKHKLKCDKCNATFKKTTYLKRHILTHTDEKPFKCDICNWGFFQHCNLKRHMISHNVDNGTEGFKCQHCQASFTTKSVLSVHMRDAHGDKLPTKKEQSRNTGTMVAAAAAAAAVAAASPPKTSPEKTSPPPAVAPSAEAAKLPSTSSSPVAAVGANWSQCRVCHKYFVTDANLKQHMLLHEGRKPFQCNFCGLRFSHKPNWKKHLMTHTPATEGYPCPTCSILFKTREDLAQHILKQHPLDSGGAAGVASGSSSNMDEEEEIPSPMDTDEPVVKQTGPVGVQMVKQSPVAEVTPTTSAKANPPEHPKVSTPKSASAKTSTPDPKVTVTTPKVAVVKASTPNEQKGATTPKLASDSKSTTAPKLINPKSGTPASKASVPNRSTTPNPRTVTPTEPCVTPSDKAEVKVKTDVPTPKPAKPATVYACAICKATFLKVAQRNRHINDNHSLISPASKT